MVEIKANYECSGAGQIQIVDEVIAVIAGTAAMEIEGITLMSGHHISDFTEILGKKNLAKGVRVEAKENEIEVTLNAYIKLGYKIHEVSANVQNRVKTAIETMTGLTEVVVNINVAGVTMEKERSNKHKNVEDIQLDN